MSHTEMWQVATREIFESARIPLTTEREVKQPDKLYTTLDGLSRDFQVTTGMVMRHYYLLNGHTPDAWGIPELRPIYGTDLKIILENEPSEEV